MLLKGLLLLIDIMKKWPVPRSTDNINPLIEIMFSLNFEKIDCLRCMGTEGIFI